MRRLLPTTLGLALLLSACQGTAPAGTAPPATRGLPGAAPAQPGLVAPAPAVAPAATQPGRGIGFDGLGDDPEGGVAWVRAPELATRRVDGEPTGLPAASADHLAGSLLVGLREGADPLRVLAEPGLAGFEPLAAMLLNGRPLLKLAPPAGMTFAEARRRLVRAPGVRLVEENAVRRPSAFTFTERDPQLDAQWAHRADRANTEAAWEAVPLADQAKVIVAVLDTGLDVTHPEFAGRVVDPRNFTYDGGEAEVTDDVGHGTHVAGIVGAAGNNDVGVAGVAWGVKIMPVKVLSTAGGQDYDIVSGVLHAVRYRPSPDDGSRVRVINLSLGSDVGSVSSVYAEAFAEARAAGVTVVVATGNSNVSQVAAPANTPDCLAVGATANYAAWEKLAHFSNHGDRLDLTAPGADILSTTPEGGVYGVEPGYARMSGTSMAAPFVAGVAALVYARYDKQNASLTAAFADKVRTRLLAAVDDLGTPGWDPYFGAGRTDAGRAVGPATLDAAP